MSARVASAGRDVARDDVDRRGPAADRAHHVEHALRVAVRRVHDEHVDVRRHQGVGTLERVPAMPTAAAARRRPSASLQAAGYFTAFWMSLTVMSPFSLKSAVDDEELLDLVLVQDLAGFVERGAHGHRDQR